MNDLDSCLNRMGEKPLKLIAEKVYEQFHEKEWRNSKWSFDEHGGNIESKELLPNEEDTFQFSIANSRSKQEFHVHKNVYEIFASYSTIEITYIDKNEKKTLKVSNGALIVPPGVVHKIKLEGITFVFQASGHGSKIHNDKKIVNIET